MTKSKKNKSKGVVNSSDTHIGSKKSLDVATFYGFRVIQCPTIEKEDRDFAKTIYHHQPPKKNDGAVSLEEKVSILRAYENNLWNKQPQPLMIYYEGSLSKSKKASHEIHLEILGTSKSIAEATIIKTAFDILVAEGKKDFTLSINSIGDKDSSAKFTREFTAYCKKISNIIHSPCSTNLRREELSFLNCKHVKCEECAAGAPDPVSFLTEPSRQHFTEVLEYLETSNIPFNIDPCLMISRKMFCHTIFEFRDEAGKLLAQGFRYNELSKKIGFRRELPAVGVTIFLDEAKTKTMKISDRKPKIYFIQLGYDAKLKSLEVMDILRSHNLPVAQSIAKDKMSGQLQIAESLNIPFCIIIGQKEALDKTVIFRNMKDHSQDIVPTQELSSYLKRAKIS